MQIKLCLCCMYSKAYEIKFFGREFAHILSWQWTWKFLMWDNLNNMRNVMNILCYIKDMVNNNCPYLFCLSILWPYHMGHTHNSLFAELSIESFWAFLLAVVSESTRSACLLWNTITYYQIHSDNKLYYIWVEIQISKALPVQVFPTNL